jgi:dGTPase
MRLNEDLAETIALGHDLGHTPFGHLGEDVLDERLRNLVETGKWSPAGGPAAAGFRHSAQSLRVVDVLEGDGGLNLTWEVRDGIREHSSEGRPGTLEGKIVQLADRIAYLNHDIDDAVRAGVLDQAAIPARVAEVLGSRHAQRINTMVVDVIRNSPDGSVVDFSPAVAEAADTLEQFMFDRVYLGPATVAERQRASRLLKLLFGFYIEHPEELREPYGGAISPATELPRAVADYVAGMTDRYAINQFQRHFIPSSVGVREGGEDERADG